MISPSNDVFTLRKTTGVSRNSGSAWSWRATEVPFKRCQVDIEKNEIRLEPARCIQGEAAVVLRFDQILSRFFERLANHGGHTWLIVHQENFLQEGQVQLVCSRNYKAARVPCGLPY